MKVRCGSIKVILIVVQISIFSLHAFSQTIDFTKVKLEPHLVYSSVEKMGKKTVVKVVKDSTVKKADEPTFVKLSDIQFKDGTIEVKVLSRLLPNASPTARGFIGVAFRVSDDYSKFESIYIRPTNGRAEDQIRRNHSIQYFSYPDYKFDRLRKEFPERYESYADMGLNEWIKMKVVVKGTEARLFLNDQKQPSLIVTDLKLGDTSGSIGLFVDVGTEGYFADLKIYAATNEFNHRTN